MGEEMGEEILDKLLSGDFSIIEPIVKEMSDSAKQQYLDEIIPKLEDRNADVRRRAAVALGGIGDARAVKPLISALKDNDRNVCNKAEEALAKIYAPAVEPLIGALKDESAYARANVTRTLGRIGSGIEKGFAPRSIIEDIVNALTNVYKEDPKQGNKEIAKNALDNIKAKQRIERLKRIFGFEEVDEEKYKKSPLNEEAVIRDIAILKTDMNWVKRFMWVIISLIGSLIGGVLIRFLV